MRQKHQLQSLEFCHCHFTKCTLILVDQKIVKTRFPFSAKVQYIECYAGKHTKTEKKHLLIRIFDSIYTVNCIVKALFRAYLVTFLKKNVLP